MSDKKHTGLGTALIDGLSLEQAKDWLKTNDPNDGENGFDWAMADMTREEAIGAIKDNIATFGLSELYVKVETGTKEQEVRSLIEKLESDPILYHKPVSVTPLKPILIPMFSKQIQLYAKLEVLYWVLGEEMPDYQIINAKEPAND
ncbi:hypothetical protein [Vibrio europaeus]|uniref:hypothetical protein n=1 Tax=Vibrio europaeus TaxID=300876 RepID=UPI00233F407B|nr:hypothetical protein [Vibrio europaeus]MDC5753549.1 hypothetical protein [Vibrio europaeus]MDC5816539.1 hypothetical protein [Vibrio europaeus]